MLTQNVGCGSIGHVYERVTLQLRIRTVRLELAATHRTYDRLEKYTYRETWMRVNRSHVYA